MQTLNNKAGNMAEVVRRLRFCPPKKEVTDGRTDTPFYIVVAHDEKQTTQVTITLKTQKEKTKNEPISFR